jgi:UDP-3-O-[3-hydroxymyristoyl] glucosamine N-acyltransferase
MKKFKQPLSALQISKILPGEKLIRKESTVYNNVSSLSDADENSICFFENPKLAIELENSLSGLLIVPLDFDVNLKPNINLIKSGKPYLTFMILVKYWLEADSKSQPHTISDSSFIPATAFVGQNVHLGRNTVIGENSKIGDNTIVESNCVIAENVSIGKNCRLFPNVTVYADTEIKNNVILHSGCVIGADGFGYLFHEGLQQKIPHVGNVIIENDVEIGANSTVDRSTLSTTIIGKGTKIDNLVQVGHNCIVGENSILCAQVGLAGSTEIGNNVFVAGQVGVAGHLKIGDNTMVGAQSGVSHTIAPNSKVFGTPARDAKLQKRILASQTKLPEMAKQLRKK